MHNSLKLKSQSGFTLIELLVVIGIIAILATIGAINFSSARAKARDAKRLSDIKNISTAIAVEAAGSAPGLYPTSGGLPTEVTDLEAPQSDGDDAYCYYVDDDVRTAYYVVAMGIEEDDNSAINGQGWTGATNTTGWNVIKVNTAQAGSTSVCPAVGASIPDCLGSESNYCLSGS